jgi:hypothetical protein
MLIMTKPLEDGRLGHEAARGQEVEVAALIGL